MKRGTTILASSLLCKLIPDRPIRDLPDIYADYWAKCYRVAALREWFVHIIEEANTLEEARGFARRALDEEDCPG